MNAFDIIDQFFRNLTTEQALLLAILAVLVLMVGVVIGWIVQGSKTRRYRKQLLLLQRERDEYAQLQEQATADNRALKQEVERLSREKTAAYDQLQLAQNQAAGAADLSSRLDTYAATVEELEAQILGLQAENDRLRAAAATTNVTEPGGGAAGAETTETAPLGDYLAAFEDRFAAFERRLDELGQAVQPGFDPGGYVPTIGQPAGEAAPATAPGGDPLVIRADITEPGVRTGAHGRTEVVVETSRSLMSPPLEAYREKRDDLTQIDSVGTFLEEQLNQQGIYCFEQIAAWTEEDTEAYAKKIGFLAAGIRKNRWVEQARELAAAAPAPAETSPEPTAHDDLKVVEGIGPKIEEVLRGGGILTLSQLAAASPDELRELLSAAGSRFRSHDPGSWPRQAALARDGQWEELSQLQGRLDGGR